jgi:hypothetical protein
LRQGSDGAAQQPAGVACNGGEHLAQHLRLGWVKGVGLRTAQSDVQGCERLTGLAPTRQCGQRRRHSGMPRYLEPLEVRGQQPCEVQQALRSQAMPAGAAVNLLPIEGAVFGVAVNEGRNPQGPPGCLLVKSLRRRQWLAHVTLR